MKQSEFKKIITECVTEVLAEGRKSKKSLAKEKAKKAIKEILTENELDESELEEIFGFGNKKPATPEEIDTYLASRPKLKAQLIKTNQLDAWKKEVSKPEYGDSIRKKESFTIKKGDNNMSFGGGLFETKKTVVKK